MFNYVNIIYLVYIILYIILEPGGGGKHDSVNRIILPKKNRFLVCYLLIWIG